MTASFFFDLAQEADTVKAGSRLASLAKPGMVIYLEGQLGAGKTTFTRGFVQHLGHQGAVKSPTYTLVEPYENLSIPVYHFDLYRLGDPEELAYMGIRDYMGGPNICLIEWPVRGQGFLPEPDIRLELAVHAVADSGLGRRLKITAISKAGQNLLDTFVST